MKGQIRYFTGLALMFVGGGTLHFNINYAMGILILGAILMCWGNYRMPTENKK